MTASKILTNEELTSLGNYAISQGFSKHIPDIRMKSKKVPYSLFRVYKDVIVRLDKFPPTAPFKSAGSFQVYVYQKDKFGKFNPNVSKNSSCVSKKTIDNLNKKYL